jgi:hypothetical protein
MTISPNGPPGAAPGTIQSDHADERPESEICSCGHPRSLHDSIATRYCDATAAGELIRDCVCRTSSGTYPART